MQFSSQINKFQTLGTYDYKFDEAENVIANSASAEFSYNYLSLPLMNSVYDNTSIESYYDVNFTEFVPVKAEPVIGETATIDSNVSLIEENSLLRDKINELISKSFPQSPSTQHQQDIFNMFFVLDQKHGLKNYIKVNYKSDI